MLRKSLGEEKIWVLNDVLDRKNIEQLCWMAILNGYLHVRRTRDRGSCVDMHVSCVANVVTRFESCFGILFFSACDRPFWPR